jgi:subtilisin family serine protease
MVSTYDFASGYELPIGIAIDQVSNKIIITGASASSANNWDYATVEYDFAGNYLAGIRNTAAGSGFDKPTAIKREATGNLYITGSAFNTVTNSMDVKTVKLNAALAVQWIKTYDGIGQDDQGNDLEVTPTGEVIVGGYIKNGANGKDYALIKYDAAGNLLWERRVDNGSATDDEITKIAIHGIAEIVATGKITENGATNFMTLGYTNQGDIVFEQRLDGGFGNDFPSDIQIDLFGNYYVVGGTFNGANDINTVVKYAKEQFSTNITTATNGEQYLANQIIVRFNHNLINPTIANTTDIQFARLSDLLPASTVSNISLKLGIGSVANWRASKVFSWMTSSDSISISRNGDSVVLDKLWSTYIIQVPDEMQDTEAYLDSLNTMQTEIVYAERNCIQQFQSNDTHVNSQFSVINNSSFPDAPIKADYAWSKGVVGSQYVSVGVIDEAVDWAHQDFGNGTFAGSKIAGGKDYNNGGVSISTVTNFPTGHGTACAGIIGALSNDGQGIAGIAGGDMAVGNTGVKLFSLACAGSTAGTLNVAATANAIAEGAAKTFNGGFGCHILSNSYGGAFFSQTQHNAMVLAYDNAVLFVASRGNRYAYMDPTLNTLDNFLACDGDKLVLNVGASGNNGQHKQIFVNGDADYESMYDKGVDIIAPGSLDICLSTLANGATTLNPFTADPTKYTAFSGTSSACPHAAGAATLLLSEHNVTNQYPYDLDNDDLEHLLVEFADNVGSEAANIVGSGKVDLQQTLPEISAPNYCVYHSEHGSFTGSISVNLSNQTVNLPKPIKTVPSGNYIATQLRCTYYYTITLPGASNYPVVKEIWGRGSGYSGVSPMIIDEPFTNIVTWSQSGNTVWVTAETFVWKIQTTLLGAAINTFIPAPTNQVLPKFSIRVYDPVSVIGVPDVNATSTINVYPNPSADNAVVSINTKYPETAKINICNVNGQILQTINSNLIATSTNQVIIDTQQLPNGIYFVSINGLRNNKTAKLVVNH